MAQGATSETGECRLRPAIAFVHIATCGTGPTAIPGIDKHPRNTSQRGLVDNAVRQMVETPIVLLAALRRTIATPTGRLRADRLLLRMPLLGNVAKMVSISRLASTLATMLSSGVQLLEALDVAKHVMNNRVLEQAVSEAREHIREGQSIATPLKRSGLFPPLVTHMIGVGEKSGELEDMLRRISQIYDAEVDRVISRLTSLMEPIMILLMGSIVFFIVLAILLPIFQMSQIVK